MVSPTENLVHFPLAPLISVVVPTCRRIDLLTRCLEALQPKVQLCPQEVYETIVTDDGKDPELTQRLAAQMPWVKVILGPGKGPAANRNNGAKAARGEWLIFIDDDCIPSPQCLVNYKQAIERYPKIEVFEGAIESDRPKRSLAEEAPLNTTGGVFWSCNVGVKKACFNELGGFDEAFPYAAYEDMDFAKRLKAAKKTTLFLKEAAVCHPWRTIGAWKKFTRQRRSALIYMRKHPDEWATMRPWMVFKIAIGRCLLQTLPGLIKYQGRGFLSAMTYDCLDIAFAGYLFFKRRALSA